MTVTEAITRIDELKPNSYPLSEKVRWLSAVDACVAERILGLSEETVSFSGYTGEGDTPLLVPAPYDEMYLHFLSAQMDLYNGEYTRFNNSMALYETGFRDYENCCRRNHLPRGRSLKFH